MLHGVPRKKRPVKNMGQFTSLCIILAWGGQVHLLCIILILLYAIASTKHLLCSVFWFYTCVCVCVCVSGRGRGVALLHDFWDLSSLTKD